MKNNTIKYLKILNRNSIREMQKQYGNTKLLRDTSSPPQE